MAGNTAITNTNTANNNNNKNETWLQRNGDYLFQAGAAAAQLGVNIYNNNQQNKFNAREAEKNRQFEQEMSNTAYQRAYEDMAKAGLNPNLAGGAGGASTPAGANASGSMAESPDLMGIGTYNNQTALTKAQVDNLNAQTEAQTLSNPYIPKKTKAEIAKTQAETKLAESQRKEVVARFLILSEQAKQETRRTITVYEEAKTKEAKLQAERAFYKTTFGKAIHQLGLTLEEVSSIVPFAGGKKGDIIIQK